MKILDSGPEHLETGSLGKFSLEKKKKCEISHLGGGVWTKLGHFKTFFFLLCPKSCKSAKKFFSSMVEGYLLT